MLTQLKRYLTETRPYLSHTQQRYHANYLGTDAMMGELIAHAASLRGTVGGPDTIPTEDIQANQVFTGDAGGIDYRGVIPFVSEVQSPSLGGHEGTFLPMDLMDHMRLGSAAGSPSIAGILPVWPQYVVWIYNTFTPDAAVSGYQAYRWSTGILPYIQSISGAVTSGASSTLIAPASVPCPTGFTGGCQ
jgi:hypothetical protein